MTPAELRLAIVAAMNEAAERAYKQNPDIPDEEYDGVKADAALRVVREAMREPSEEMCAEGAAAVDLEMYPENGMATTRAAARACLIMALAASPLREPEA